PQSIPLSESPLRPNALAERLVPSEEPVAKLLRPLSPSDDSLRPRRERLLRPSSRVERRSASAERERAARLARGWRWMPVRIAAAPRPALAPPPTFATPGRSRPLAQARWNQIRVALPSAIVSPVSGALRQFTSRLRRRSSSCTCAGGGG